ncbi:MAG: hypothetical protein ACK5N0_04315 [Synechococcaceae cyanobacterium]
MPAPQLLRILGGWDISASLGRTPPRWRGGGNTPRWQRRTTPFSGSAPSPR